MSRLARGTYIGGQQMAAIVGMHPYMSIGDVYAKCALGLDRKGSTSAELDADPSVPNVLRRGLICEPGVIDYVERIALLLPRGTLKRDIFLQDEEIPYLAGTLDAVELGDDGSIEHVHEITVTSTRNVDAWGPDGDPQGAAKYKWIQCQYYQGLSGASGGTIWLFVSDTGELRRYPCDRRDQAIERLRGDAEQFWLENVLPKKAPAVDCVGIGAWAQSEQSLDAIYAVGDGGEIPSTPEMVEAANMYARYREEVKEAEEKKRGYAAQLKSMLGNNTHSRWDGGRVSWKRNKPRKKIDYEAAFKSLLEDEEQDKDKLEQVLQAHTEFKNGARIMRVNIRKTEEEK